MCNLGVGGLVLQGAGTLLGFAGSMQQGKAAQAAANYNAAVNRNNAILAQRAADDARKAGEIEEQKSRMATNQLKGRQRASSAAQGVLVDEGSALELVLDTAQIGEHDAQVIRGNAERRALALEAQGVNFESQATMQTFSGSNAARAGMIGGVGTLLTGTATVAKNWYDYNRLKG